MIPRDLTILAKANLFAKIMKKEELSIEELKDVHDTVMHDTVENIVLLCFSLNDVEIEDEYFHDLAEKISTFKIINKDFYAYFWKFHAVHLRNNDIDMKEKEELLEKALNSGRENVDDTTWTTMVSSLLDCSLMIENNKEKILMYTDMLKELIK